MHIPFTHKKITEVKDMGPEMGAEGRAEVRFAGADFDAEQTGFTHHVLKPNVHSAFGHRHQEAEEVYIVLRGSGRMKLDDEIIEIEELDVIRVSPEVWRGFSAGPDGLEALAFGARHVNDGEVDPQWWIEGEEAAG